MFVVIGEYAFITDAASFAVCVGHFGCLVCLSPGAQRKLMLQISTFTVSADFEADLWLGGVSGFTSDCGHTCKDGHSL